ncbi:hypothetical protein Hypma_012876 [Hypsizygus marmoreus]|uniref:Uncharacterized protein n=1 Tax=Hypsizygus marmoreus TaxID=39966 RepID=A0A369JDY2_HYPMA|nr:hypothetical protein Hypma_012876 [Hypsizygus marmoreus]
MSSSLSVPELATSNWASRNPSLNIQPARVRLAKNNDDASRRTHLSHKVKNNKANVASVEKEIDAYLMEQQRFIEEIADKYTVDAKIIKKKLINGSTYKTTRAPSLQNAIIHDKTVEMNEGRAPGDRLKLKEIQQLVLQDEELQNLSKDRQNELLKNLEDHRALHATGARAGNHAANVDASKNIDSIIKNMYLRTGVRTIAFFTRSHVNDDIVPVVGASDDPALKFFPEVLKLDTTEVVAKFELFACVEDKAGFKVDTLASMRADCTRLILDGLRKILHDKKITMNYANFETVIVEAHHVRLVGWPRQIPFGSPSKLSTTDDVRALRASLQDGECKWEVLNALQRREHSKALTDARGRGDAIVKKRKQRSDSGTTRKGGDGQPPSKKKRKQPSAASMVPPVYKSSELIDDDDEDEDQGGGHE